MAVTSAIMGVEESLYFPAWMRDELTAIAKRLGTDIGTVAWSAWEAAKHQLYSMTALFEDFPPEGSLPPVAKIRPAPPSKPPPRIALPATAPLLELPTDAHDKVMLTLTLPERVMRELRSFSVGADQSLSWTLQQAIRLVRPRLHAATPR